MKNTFVLLIVAVLTGAGMLACALPAHAAQVNTQSPSSSAAPPDSEFLIFPDMTDGKPALATKPAAESKPATADQTSQAAAPATETPHVNASLLPTAPNAPRPPRLIAPPGW